MNTFVAATLSDGKLEILCFPDADTVDEQMKARKGVKGWRVVDKSDLPDRQQRNAWIDTGMAIVLDQALVKAPVFSVYKADLWRRATDTEVDAIAAGLAKQPMRLQLIFRDADHLQSDDPMFGMLQQQFVAVFGQKRADELLAPSL